MAYFVAKVLKIRPNEILDNWTGAELCIAYGQYANDISRQNYEQWESMGNERHKIEKPRKYNVKFYAAEDDE